MAELRSVFSSLICLYYLGVMNQKKKLEKSTRRLNNHLSPY